MSNFYGSSPGQNFLISATFPNAIELQKELSQNYVALNEYVLINYGHQGIAMNNTEVSVYDYNANLDLEQFKQNYNGTLWQKIYGVDTSALTKFENKYQYKDQEYSTDQVITIDGSAYGYIQIGMLAGPQGLSPDLMMNEEVLDPGMAPEVRFLGYNYDGKARYQLVLPDNRTFEMIPNTDENIEVIKIEGTDIISHLMFKSEEQLNNYKIGNYLVDGANTFYYEIISKETVAQEDNSNLYKLNLNYIGYLGITEWKSNNITVAERNSNNDFAEDDQPSVTITDKINENGKRIGLVDWNLPAGKTPIFISNTKFLDPASMPTVEIDNTDDIDNPKITFSLPISRNFKQLLQNYDVSNNQIIITENLDNFKLGDYWIDKTGVRYYEVSEKSNSQIILKYIGHIGITDWQAEVETIEYGEQPQVQFFSNTDEIDKNIATLHFSIPKGKDAEILGATTSLEEDGGAPDVKVALTGETAARNFDFRFKNLKGDVGLLKIVAGKTIQDNGSGASITEQILNNTIDIILNDSNEAIAVVWQEEGNTASYFVMSIVTEQEEKERVVLPLSPLKQQESNYSDWTEIN